MDPPLRSGQRDAPRRGGGRAEPALVAGRVDVDGRGVVGVGKELDDAGLEGGRCFPRVEADAEESGKGYTLELTMSWLATWRHIHRSRD